MGEPSERDTEALRARARERIEQGRLPHGKAVRTWGGLGTGLRCDLCDAPIASNEPEFELQFDLASAESVRLHRQCHAVWNEVRASWQPGAWRPVGRELPPLNTVVEARVGLRETRAIILNVICLNETPAAAWINATTGSPLPEGWRPFEWRPLRDAQPRAAAGRAAEPTTPSLPKRA